MFIHNLLGNKFVFYVNHMALVYLVNKPHVWGRITKWLLYFLEYAFIIIYKLSNNASRSSCSWDIRRNLQKYSWCMFTWDKKESSKSSMPCHEIFLCHVEILCDVAKYSMTYHEIFCDITCVVCLRINTGLLIINMGLANRTTESSIMWGFESKRK
jgi:hypothetical protein